MTCQPFPSIERFVSVFLRMLVWCAGGLLPVLTRAEPVDFNLPAQPVAEALLAFSKQTKIEVLFSFDELRKVQSIAVTGRYEPEDALSHLLRDTGFASRRNGKGKFVVTPTRQPTGSIKGRLLNPGGVPVPGIRVTAHGAGQSVVTDLNGEFDFESVRPGTYQLSASGAGYQSLQIAGVQVDANRVQTIEPHTMKATDETVKLEPYLVEGKSGPLRPFGRNRDSLPPRTSVGNVDLPRTENDALPFTIYDRDQITRSGAVSLNEFLQKAMLDGNASSSSPEQDGRDQTLFAGSINLNLRGFNADETVVLVNGRRLPEILTSGPGGSSADPQQSIGDVNFIPLSLVQQVEVLPVSASALYSGNAVGGVINIVLRPDLDATEVTATYTNALGRFDAPQSSVSLLYGRSLLGGKLHFRLNANFTKSVPPTEAELGYHQARLQPPFALEDPIYRATPNIRSADGTSLSLLGASPVTSVAPGADGTGGPAAFANRQGVRNLDFFHSPGGSLTASPNSLDYAYGRRQQRSAYFASAVYDVFPWLQLGLDGTYVSTVINRGYDVETADLTLSTSSALNPFKQDVKVSLNETTLLLGANYSEARLDFSSAVLGLLVKLPADWQVSFDTQYAHNIAKYRGLALPDAGRWQQLADQGLYNPLRDTQVHNPPAEFYDRVLVYYGGRGRFVTLGDYDTLDAALRITNRSLSLPTGSGAVNFGGDYRRNQLASYTDERRFGDGSLAEVPIQWTGRTLQRYSAFGELQAPVLPERWLPHWLRKIETDLAVRYVAADTAKETNVAPTFALKIDLAGGLTLRGSLTTSNRFPTPQMSRRVDTPVLTGGSGSDTLVTISDPLRNQSYDVLAREALNPSLSTEAAVTQTAGAVFQRGRVHRLRLAVDFVDTRKVNELVTLGPPDVIDLEQFFPERVIRAPLQSGDTHSAGLVTSLITGTVNLASRHSQNWNTSLDYMWTECLGGTLELYGRWLYFQRYDRQLLPNSPFVDELNRPDASGLLKHRVNFGAGWSNQQYGFGLDGHYYHSRILPQVEWPSQGHDRINPYWQFDAYLQSDLGRWLPWKSSRYGLRGQLRVNNVFGNGFVKYANDPSGAGVQPYGDWRGRVYSLSLTATF